MKDVVGEQRPVAIVLIIAVVDAAQIVEPVEQVEGRKDVGARRAARAGDRRRADAGDGAERACRRIEEIEPAARDDARSEEHTSELQSLMRISYAVFCLKKKESNKCNKRDSNYK